MDVHYTTLSFNVSTWLEKFWKRFEWYNHFRDKEDISEYHDVLGKPCLNKYNPSIDLPTNFMVIKTPRWEHISVGGPIKKLHYSSINLTFISSK